MEENRNEVLETLEEQKAEDVETCDWNPIMEDYDEDCNAGFGAGLLGGLGIAAVGYGIYRGIKWGKKKYDNWKNMKNGDLPQAETVEGEVVVEEEPDTEKKKK